MIVQRIALYILNSLCFTMSQCCRTSKCCVKQGSGTVSPIDNFSQKLEFATSIGLMGLKDYLEFIRCLPRVYLDNEAQFLSDPRHSHKRYRKDNSCEPRVSHMLKLAISACQPAVSYVFWPVVLRVSQQFTKWIRRVLISRTFGVSFTYNDIPARMLMAHKNKYKKSLSYELHLNTNVNTILMSKDIWDCE